MPRKKSRRCIEFSSDITYYKPRGVPMKELQVVHLDLDEIEAVRLRNYEKLYQENAAKKMEISRQTFGRILESAHAKIADALVNGKAIELKIDNQNENSNPSQEQ